MSDVYDSQCLFSKPSVDGTASDNVQIDGRIRLFNIWVCLGDQAAGGASGRNPMIFRNDSSSITGDVLLKYVLANPNWGPFNNNVIIPGNGILFPDGLTFVTGNSDSGASGTRIVSAVTLIYQKG